MRTTKNILILCLFGFMLSPVCFGQDEWIAPESEKENVSIFTFDEEFSRSGEVLYNNSCLSCHGDPTQSNYTPMVPPPGDVADTKIQNQTDGELYHKIIKGRGAMPGFEDALSAEEVWSLIAYFRSFNETYEQPVPNLEGIEIPVLTLQLGYDDNVDKLVVKVFDEAEKPFADASVSAFVKGFFGNLLLGKSQTNDAGIAYFDVDSKLPGDLDGKIEVLVKASKSYGSVKEVQELEMVEPTLHANIIEGRHLWSVSKKAPIWLMSIFIMTLVSIWGAIFFILIGLRKIKKTN